MNSLFYTTAIGQMICLAVAFALPVLMAEDDAIEIELNGSIDSLAKYWHKTSSVTRAIVIGSLGVASLLPAALMGGYWFESGSMLFAYGLLAIALHWVIFDLKLNRLRGLADDYNGKTADLDQYLAKFAAAEITRLKRQTLCVASAAYLAAGYVLFIQLF